MPGDAGGRHRGRPVDAADAAAAGAVPYERAGVAVGARRLRPSWSADDEGPQVRTVREVWAGPAGRVEPG
ncbi:hypothetical protein VV01_06545 [Luteipulveratus halotolerans]|uniref:Uncharacterized protein n=1 Tax=Luteipulveratus halotolerans TaxID=1631356 RepID=A0A0L6CH13_9MICO|nr:hypothetical protein VV01_06545 [Luteipulveratus halotolerans]